jgi:hypothetical protein
MNQWVDGWVGGWVGGLIDRKITTKDIDMETLFVQAPRRLTRQFCPHHEDTAALQTYWQCMALVLTWVARPSTA